MPTKIVLVTGGTSGIGAAVAEALASYPWTIVIVGRDRERCESTAARIRRTSGNPHVDCLVADLSSQAAVREAAREFRARYDALHLLINNVGALFLNRRDSADGIEMTLALNHLAPFLLTHMLRDRLQAGAPARIVNVSSSGHHLSPGLRRDDLQWRRGIYRGFQAYHQSKLANLLFTYELARRLHGSGITVNAVHPGFVSTNIGRDNPWYWRMLKPVIATVFRVRAITAAESAKGVVHVATSPDLEQVSGGYFENGIAAPSSVASQDADAARWLWAMSEDLTGLRTANEESGRIPAESSMARIVQPPQPGNAIT
jgi:NAD(P)-dependent dehydrogenase (short-subunit alcohol dehydrogenase family)